MRIRDLHRFFEDLARRVDFPVRLFLLGGAAALLYGSRRVTHDVDFEVHLVPESGRSREARWKVLQGAIQKAGAATGVTPQYSEDVDRWSLIVLPGYRRASRLYRRFGRVEVRLLSPLHWAIGKLARYLPSDLQDLETVFKHEPGDPHQAARLWGRALGGSPTSSLMPLFRQQVLYFFRECAPRIWGKAVDPAQLCQEFLSAARHARRYKLTT